MKKIFDYNLSRKTKNGLYCDIDEKGQAYNVLLFLQKYSKRTLRGKIVFSNIKEEGFIMLTKGKYNNSFSTNFWFTSFEDGGEYNSISLDPWLIPKSWINIWVKVIPNTKNK